MKILIRQHRLFLTWNNYWIDSPDKALSFQTGVEAIDYVAQRGLLNVELFYSFDNVSDNFSVPLGAGTGTSKN